jgi:phosphate starvation-inducible protein PhoH
MLYTLYTNSERNPMFTALFHRYTTSLPSSIRQNGKNAFNQRVHGLTIRNSSNPSFTSPSQPLIKKHLTLTVNQEAYVDALRDEESTLVIGVGPPGTGKTLLACSVGLDGIVNNKYSKLIITRPCVSIQRDMGFLPGDIQNKMEPWLIPIFDNLDIASSVYPGKKSFRDKVEIAPLSFIRGRTFTDAFIIADEMQNASAHELKSLLTRIGSNCKMVLTGDPSQCDLLGASENGLSDLITRLQSIEDPSTFDRSLNEIKKIQFNIEDIKRSGFTRLIAQIYSGNV